MSMDHYCLPLDIYKGYNEGMYVSGYDSNMEITELKGVQEKYNITTQYYTREVWYVELG